MTDPISHKIYIIHDHKFGGRRNKCRQDRWENRCGNRWQKQEWQKQNGCEKPVLPSKDECLEKAKADKAECLPPKVDCCPKEPPVKVDKCPKEPVPAADTTEKVVNSLTDQEKRRLGRILSAKRGEDVVVTDKTRVSEEDLYALAVMNKINPKLKRKFIDNLADARVEMKKEGVKEFFPAVDKAMRQLIKDGEITKKEFTELKQFALGKAQLDGRKAELSTTKQELGDGSTGSVIDTFRNNSEATMRQVRRHRWLQDKWEKETGITSQIKTPKEKSTHSLEGSGEFLWKPVSESDGKLVVLIPSALTGMVAGVSIQTENGKVIDEGRFKGVGNGGREHFRFSNAGGSYPDGVVVVIKLNDGSEKRIVIKETSDRFTE